PLLGEHPGRIAHAQAVAEEALGPGERVGAVFDRDDLVQVLFAHRPQPGPRPDTVGLRAHLAGDLLRSARNCGHSARLPAGVRSTTGGGQDRHSAAASGELRSRPAARNSASYSAPSGTSPAPGSTLRSSSYPIACSASRWTTSQLMPRPAPRPAGGGPATRR